MTVPKPSSVTGRKPSAVSAPRSAAVISSARTREPTGASGAKPPHDARRDDEAVGVAAQRGGREGGRDGGGGQGRADPGGEEVTGLVRAVQGHPRQPYLAAGPGQRPGHRVPFGGDGGGHEDAGAGRGQSSFLSLNDHRPVTAWLSFFPSPALMETRVESPWAPYWALKNTLPGMVR